jgi:hypothetical protein
VRITIQIFYNFFDSRKLKESMSDEEGREKILRFVENVGVWDLPYEQMSKLIIQPFSQFLPPTTVKHIVLANFAKCPVLGIVPPVFPLLPWLPYFLQLASPRKNIRFYEKLEIK